MSDHYWITIRNQLLTEIRTHAGETANDVIPSLTLRPPKNLLGGIYAAILSSC
ncbi:hypothetical protein [Sneathiella glossodoripedis]|uniref:hypothetical protein n=1 Tax=Sneathiella glossodoripedis TaxID=418853 RepID=UPI00131EDD60|nr:hypothetical protein [Sneathiella glossodoripedis]